MAGGCDVEAGFTAVELVLATGEEFALGLLIGEGLAVAADEELVLGEGEVLAVVGREGLLDAGEGVAELWSVLFREGPDACVFGMCCL